MNNNFNTEIKVYDSKEAAKQLLEIASEVIEKTLQDKNEEVNASIELSEETNKKFLELRQQLENLSYVKIKEIISELNEINLPETIDEKNNREVDFVINSLLKTNKKLEILLIYALSLMLTSTESLTSFFSPRMIEVFSKLSDSYAKNGETVARLRLDQKRIEIEEQKNKLQEKRLILIEKELEMKDSIKTKENQQENSGNLNNLIEEILLKKEIQIEDPYNFDEHEKEKIEKDLKIVED